MKFKNNTIKKYKKYYAICLLGYILVIVPIFIISINDLFNQTVSDHIIRVQSNNRNSINILQYVQAFN